jgi:predicted nucleic acid-binding Zn ribbon protein
MAEIIPQHTHCLICGKSIIVSETLCSEQCKQKYSKMLRIRKINGYLMYVMIFAVFVVAMLVIFNS